MSKKWYLTFFYFKVKIEQELGRGAFGTVFKGRDKDDNTIAVEKVSTTTNEDHKKAATKAVRYHNMKENIDHQCLAVADPGFPIWGVLSRLVGADLRRGHVLTKMHAKTKELVPMGGISSAPWIRQCLMKVHDVKYKNRAMWIFMEFCDLLLLEPVEMKVKIMKQIADDIGRSRGCHWHVPPQQDPFLLLLHTFLPKSVHIGGWCPPQWVGTPPRWEILDPPLRWY